MVRAGTARYTREALYLPTSGTWRSPPGSRGLTLGLSRPLRRERERLFERDVDDEGVPRLLVLVVAAGAVLVREELGTVVVVVVVVPPLSLGLLGQRGVRWRLLLLLLLHVPQDALDGRGLEEPLEHAAGAAVLEALVGSEGVLGAVAPVAELADVQGVRLLVLVLEVALERVVAGEGAPAVGALLGLVDAAGRRRWHPVHG